MSTIVTQQDCRYAICLVVAALLFVAGCGRGSSHRGPIGGEVKLDGKPILKGSILFVPAQGTKGAVASGSIENGRYRLAAEQGPAIGPNRVEIHAMRKTGQKVPKAMAPAGEMEDEYEEAVSPQFHSATTLTFEVKPGENSASFEVRSK
jgi:hypothetical protein